MHRLPNYSSPNIFAEFDPVHTRWINDPIPAVHTGLVDPSFISNLLQWNDWLDSEMRKGDAIIDVWPEFWSQRLARPTSVEITQLCYIHHYRIAVDTITAMQSQLKEKAAWIEWAKRHLRDRLWEKKVVLAKDIPWVDDLYMGTWVNGMDNTHILWLIKEKVPIIIIHALTNHKCRALSICSLHVTQVFVANSEAKWLDSMHNSYKHVALRHGQIQSGFIGDQYI